VTDAITVDGADRLRATMGAAQRDIGDMSEAGGRTGSLIASRGRAEAPVLTGALAGSVGTATHGNETEITSGLAYSNRTHWGYRRYNQAAQPFLWNPANDLQEQWMRYYEDEANHALAKVKGA
jgi:hypothetical protein